MNNTLWDFALPDTIFIDLGYYAEESTFCALPRPTLNPIRIIFKMPVTPFFNVLRYDHFPSYKWLRATLLTARSKERIPAEIQGHCLPLADLSPITNEISRSQTQTTFDLSTNCVKVESKVFLQFFVCYFKICADLN